MHTNKQLKDGIAELTRRALKLAKNQAPDAVNWAESVSGLTLDPWQQDLMHSSASRELLLCSRQVGKTETVAMKAGYEAAYTPGSSVLVLAPTQRQSSNLFDRVHAFMDENTVTRQTRTEIELSNGSVLRCLPGDRPDFVRGLTASLAIVDESAFVKDTVMAVLFPMISTTQGRLILLSTPSGPKGNFYDAWVGDEMWSRVKVLANDCPRITPEFLEEAKLRLGDLAFRQEYLCEFVQSSEAFFSADMIAQAFEERSVPNMIQEALNVPN